MSRRQWLPRLHRPLPVAFALVVAGVLPPVGLAALPGGLSMLGAPRTGIVLLAALLFVPALVGFAVALQGFDAILTRLRDLTGGEYRQIIARVLLDGLILAYVYGLIVALPDDATIARCLLIGALNLASAWLFFLSVILDPRRSAVRRYVALVSDVTLLSILLAAGGGLTAPLAPLYVSIAIGNGEQHGGRALASATALGVAGFAAVVATTGFWQANPLLAGGMLATIAFLSLSVAAMLRRLAAAKTGAESANAAKSRFLAALGEDLRGPLRALARAGAGIDEAPADPAQSDMMARVRLMARSMLLQLDDVLNYVKIDAGTFAPDTRAFDLYRLANGAVAALRPSAAERGIVLALRIDPLLPFQLRGWPNQVRQILNCLITNTICHSGKVKVRINLDAVALGADAVTVRFTVTSRLLDNQLETAGDAAEIGTGRHLALAVADRLVALMGGRLAVHADQGGGLSLAVELPFAIDQGSQGLPLDLAHLPVLIVTKDAEFVGELIEPLEAWRAEPRWIGAGEAALNYLEAMEPGARRAVLVLDGRSDVLQALSLGHRALSLLAAMPPHLLFIADEARIDSVIGLADDELDSILPAPFTLNALRSALHALWVEPADWFLADPSPAIEPSPAPPQSRVEDGPAPAPAPEEPVVRPRSRPLPAMPPGRAPSPKRRRQILIAASNPANRRIMSSLLARAGHAVRLAETLDETLQELEAREVDVLLLDLTGAPGADYEAARRCRRARPSLTIVALTGDAPAQAERRAREVGLDAVLPKPIEPKRLLATIDAAIEDDASEAPVQAAARSVVTELASHPRFAGEAASAVDNRAVATQPLPRRDRGYGQDTIEQFRADSRRMVADIARAARAGDVAAFDGAVQALAGRTVDLDAARLREALQLMQEPTPSVLRLHGGEYVARLQTELARLDALLVKYLKTAD
ncbi:MAG TPA: response regulator [Stellaceae bacterium]|nr:response regulator [Stellaceae bacterium]